MIPLLSVETVISSISFSRETGMQHEEKLLCMYCISFLFLPYLPKCYFDRVHMCCNGTGKMQFSRILLVHSNCCLLSNWKLVIHNGNLWISLVKWWYYKVDDQDLIVGRCTAFFEQCCCSRYQNGFISGWKCKEDVVVLLIL